MKPKVTQNTGIRPIEVFRASDIVILIVGQTGSGKSTFINNIFGRQIVAVGADLTSCTDDITANILDIPGRTGERALIVDTPGFNHTALDSTAVIEKIDLWLQKHDRMRLGGVIYLQEIAASVKKVDNEQLTILKKFRTATDDSLAVVFGTTKWSESRKTEQESRETELRNTIWKALLTAGATMTRVENSEDAARGIVNDLLSKVPPPFHKSPGRTMATHTEARMPVTKPIAARHGISPPSQCHEPLIIVLGETGSGKSTFISMADPSLSTTGPKVGHGVEACTTQAEAFLVEDPEAPGTYARLLDTPGFNAAGALPDSNQLSRILDWLSEEPHTPLIGVLYLHDTTQSRLTRPTSLMPTPRDIPRPPGVVLATTKARQGQIQKHTAELEAKYHLPPGSIMPFENTRDSAWKIIRQVQRLSRTHDTTLGELARRIDVYERDTIIAQIVRWFTRLFS